MAKKSDFPKGWTPYGKPYAPTKPRRMLKSRQLLNTFTYSNYSSVSLKDFGEAADSISIEASTDGYGDTEIRVLVYAPETEVEDPHYKTHMARYHAANKKYKKELAEWEKWKAVYDAREKARKRKADLALYEKLKKEFEGGN